MMNDREILELILTKVTNIESDVAKLQADVAKLKVDVAKLQADVAKLQADVTVLQGKMERLEEKVEVIYDQTGKLTEYHTSTTHKLDSIREEQKSVYEILGQHEVHIRTLLRIPS